MYRLRTLITWQLIKVLAGNYVELELRGGCACDTQGREEKFVQDISGGNLKGLGLL